MLLNVIKILFLKLTLSYLICISLKNKRNTNFDESIESNEIIFKKAMNASLTLLKYRKRSFNLTEIYKYYRIERAFTLLFYI